jgi:hypothetical protein
MPRQPFQFDEKLSRHEAAHAVVGAVVSKGDDTFPLHAEVYPQGHESDLGGWSAHNVVGDHRDVLISMAGMVQETLDGADRERVLYAGNGDMQKIGDPALVSQYWSLVEDLLTRYRYRVNDTAALLARDGTADAQMLKVLLGGVRGQAYADLPDSVFNNKRGKKAGTVPQNASPHCQCGKPFPSAMQGFTNSGFRCECGKAWQKKRWGYPYAYEATKIAWGILLLVYGIPSLILHFIGDPTGDGTYEHPLNPLQWVALFVLTLLLIRRLRKIWVWFRTEPTWRHYSPNQPVRDSWWGTDERSENERLLDAIVDRRLEERQRGKL